LYSALPRTLSKSGSVERWAASRQPCEIASSSQVAARAARHLDDRLGEALAAAKVGAEQALVGVDHANERELRKVVAL